MGKATTFATKSADWCGTNWTGYSSSYCSRFSWIEHRKMKASKVHSPVAIYPLSVYFTFSFVSIPIHKLHIYNYPWESSFTTLKVLKVKTEQRRLQSKKEIHITYTEILLVILLEKPTATTNSVSWWIFRSLPPYYDVVGIQSKDVRIVWYNDVFLFYWHYTTLLAAGSLYYPPSSPELGKTQQS